MDRVRFALDAAQVGVWDFYPQNDELIWDTRCKAIFDFAPDADVTYAEFIACVHPLDRPRIAAVVSEVVGEDGASDYEVEYRIITRSGVERWIHVKGRVIARDSQGRATRFTGITIDVTERKRLEQEREMFLGIIGHDLRNPLAAVIAGAHLLGANALLSSRDRRITERIRSSAERMTRIIDDLLDYARGRLGGGIPIHPAAEDMGALCRQIVDELATAHPSRQLRLEVAGCLDGAWDRERAMQALSNLIGNALAHGRDPILVTVTEDGGSVEVAITNGGVPIAAVDLAVLFEPFRRGGRSGGLGLGLYITAEIVRAHGGTIRVTSNDHATTFTTLWPRGALRT
jgi:signal transduction histidine kinase